MQCIPGDQDFTFRLAGLNTADVRAVRYCSADSAKMAETRQPKKFITTDTAVDSKRYCSC